MLFSVVLSCFVLFYITLIYVMAMNSAKRRNHFSLVTYTDVFINSEVRRYDGTDSKG